MFRGLRFVAVALAVLFVAEPALAQFLPDLRITLGQRKRQVPDFTSRNSSSRNSSSSC